MNRTSSFRAEDSVLINLWVLKNNPSSLLNFKEPRKKKKEDGKQGNEIKKIRKKVILGESTFPFQLIKNLTN